MKNFVITQILPHGARFAQMFSNFKLNVCIKNDVVSLDFIGEESKPKGRFLWSVEGWGALYI